MTPGHPTWPASAASLIAFAAGAGIAVWLRGRTRRWAPAITNLLGTEIALLLWVLLAYGRHGTASRVVLTGTGALAMGSLATLFTRTAGIATAITYQSGTVAKMPTGLVALAATSLLVRGQGRRPDPPRG